MSRPNATKRPISKPWYHQVWFWLFVVMTVVACITTFLCVNSQNDSGRSTNTNCPEQFSTRLVGGRLVYLAQVCDGHLTFIITEMPTSINAREVANNVLRIVGTGDALVSDRRIEFDMGSQQDADTWFNAIGEAVG